MPQWERKHFGRGADHGHVNPTRTLENSEKGLNPEAQGLGLGDFRLSTPTFPST